MKIITRIKHIKRGAKIGLAFSGGLDTSVAVKWINDNGINVYCFYADLGGDNNPSIINLVKRSKLLGAKKIKIINCKKKLTDEAVIVIKCRAFNISTGNIMYYNTTPISRAIVGLILANEMTINGIKIWSDGSTFKGNDIERFFIYSHIVNNNLNVYKPWLDKTFVNLIKGRHQMVKYLLNSGVTFSSAKRNYSIDSNILGNTYEGDKIENLDYNLFNIDFRIIKRNLLNLTSSVDIFIDIRNGIITKINSSIMVNSVDIFMYLNALLSKCYFGISDHIEERIIGIKSRGIYEAPVMAFLHNIYDRMVSGLFDNDIINFYRANGLRLGVLLYAGKWFNEESEIRKKIALNICSKINGSVKVRILGGTLIFLDTNFYKHSKYLKTFATMEKSTQLLFSYKDRIGQLNVIKQKLDLDFFKRNISIKKILNMSDNDLLLR